MFLPATKQELDKLGIKQPDIILVSGDAYIDSPFSGTALVGKALMASGYSVAVISQPDTASAADITRLGSPRLFWGVNAGCTDSLVANYTSSLKKRKSCDFTPGGVNNRRPDRASIVYTNLIRNHDKSKKPIILGGIEASLRRLSHYDFLTDKIRKPLLFDAKADLLVYGMGEYTLIRLAEIYSRIAEINQADTVTFTYDNDIKKLEEEIRTTRGIVYISKEISGDAEMLPSFDECAENPDKFGYFFNTFYSNSSSMMEKVLVQSCLGRWAVQNPPFKMTSAQLDWVHNLEFERKTHPYERAKGEVKGEFVVKNSIPTHRGCYGECNFCAISVHQGRAVVSRSAASVLKEATVLAATPGFNGIISDAGGPTANMYGTECANMKKGTPCKDKRCLEPHACRVLEGSQYNYIKLLASLSKVKGIKKVLVSSGIRCDLAMADTKNGEAFVQALAAHHTGGQIKLAPEHFDTDVLKLMGKSDLDSYEKFVALFNEYSRRAGKKQFITCYLMAAHPGCTMESMKKMTSYINKNMAFTPEQVQIFTPTPSTWSTCMYYTEQSIDGKKIYVARALKDKLTQKGSMSGKK